MAKKKKKKNVLPSLEILIILVFFLSFIMWAASKCNATKTDLQNKAKAAIESLDQPDEIETAADASTTNINTPATTPSPTTTGTEQTTASPSTIIRERYTPLYITIDSLKLRSSPNLNASVIMKLPLFEEVIFLNEVTDSTEKINIGYEIADEPWVKVQHAKGHVGWVYGAGISYYRKKKAGVY